MKIGSLFDGIGGFPLVASWYGITAAWASEIEASPVSITKRHFPNMKHLGDITKVNGAEIEPVDIITFGSPCQDLSVAGKRAGLAGARSGLFGEAIRIIEEMREATNGLYPTWAIWENVPGAHSSNDGLDFRAVLQSFADTEIPMPASGRWGDSGMVRGGKCDFGWRVLDAQYWGVPQRRKRIFIVADFRGQRSAEVLFKSEGLRGDITESEKPWKRFAKTTGSGAVWPDVARTLAARHDSSPCIDRGQNFVYDCRGNGNGAIVNTLTGDHQNRVTDYTAICIAANTIDRKPHNGGNGKGFQEEVAYTLTAMDRHAVLASGKTATGTLMANAGTKQWLGNQEAFSGDYSIIQNNTVRRLTPLECERLQGYPDYWTLQGHDGKTIKDSARYEAIGNSLALPCVEYLIAGIVNVSK